MYKFLVERRWSLDGMNGWYTFCGCPTKEAAAAEMEHAVGGRHTRTTEYRVVEVVATTEKLGQELEALEEATS